MNKIAYIKQYVQQFGYRAAAKHFTIPQTVIYRMVKSPAPPRGRIRHIGGGRKPILDKQSEQHLVDDVLHAAKLHQPISIPQLKVQALSFGVEHFKASDGWVSSFFKRWNLTLRTPTASHSSSLLKQNQLQEAVMKYWRIIYKLRCEQHIPIRCIGNMDEVPVYFDMAPKAVIARKGSRTVCVKTNNMEKTRITVVLACLADGTKLPPMVIFRGKTKRSIANAVAPDDSMIVTYQENAWNTSALTNRWINDVWFQYVPDRSLLIWDEFAGHFESHGDILSNDCYYAIIPKACTSVMQPLDVSINKPFKTQLRLLWSIHMRQKLLAKQSTRPTKTQILEWVWLAWNGISKDIIVKSFKKCGISNALDGSEEAMTNIDWTRIV